ncbi:disulfide bond formation protein B [Pasteurella dagmatis]|uniref:Disulfide bond formation protein DsbB n=1 Tax=Pasteurella dagmatis ATCC 43325 TaxID=667128 RepID=C9PNV9_9PAST|nr:disulfide bond formation protein B [Pasteurella dagmatis]EEX50750.1 disulfide bond formation protein DsbB [Pasteurella dagmatis ATCC 43325]SNV78264.1 Disulfide bond formation protein DsbB [Pasteurella dagmatis]
MNEKVFNSILSLSALVIAIVLGVASFYLGFIDKESPCILCWAHRMLMIGTVMFAFMIVRYGPKPKYVGWIIFIGVFGMFAGFRHSSGSFAWDIHQGWWAEILGAHTYTWPIVIQGVVLVFTALLFLFTKNVYSFVSESYKPFSKLTKTTMVAFMVVVAGNIVQAFISTGYPPNMGVGNPTRLSFNPDYWYWTTDSWKRLNRPTGFRNSWDVEQPDLPSQPSTQQFILDSAQAPLVSTNKLAVIKQDKIKVPLNAPATDIAFNGADKYLVTTEKWGLYLLDNALENVKRFAVLDHLNGANGRVPVGSAFFSETEFGVLGWNKIFVFFKEDDTRTAKQNFPSFIEGLDQYSVTARGAYNTVRARMHHVLSMAYLPENNSVYSATVPSMKHKKLIISRFDKRDNLLSEEFIPAVKDGMTLREGKALADYYIMGLTAHDGALYAVSKQFSQVLKIDPVSKQITQVYEFSGIMNPQGITFKDGVMQILSYENGENILYSLSE